MKLTVKVERDDNGVALIRIEGEVDMHTSPDVKNTLQSYFRPDISGIVLDLSGVKYMDSSGIATMVEGLQWSTESGCRFVLAGMNETVTDIFVLTKLHNVFEVSADSMTAFNNITGA